MRKPEPGMVRCLGGCDKEFHSKDKKTNRICPTCAKRPGRERDVQIYRSRAAEHGYAPPGD